MSFFPCQKWVSKKKLDGGVGGWGELYPSFFGIFGIFLTLQSPLEEVKVEPIPMATGRMLERFGHFTLKEDRKQKRPVVWMKMEGKRPR